MIHAVAQRLMSGAPRRVAPLVALDVGRGCVEVTVKMGTTVPLMVVVDGVALWDREAVLITTTHVPNPSEPKVQFSFAYPPIPDTVCCMPDGPATSVATKIVMKYVKKKFKIGKTCHIQFRVLR